MKSNLLYLLLIVYATVSCTVTGGIPGNNQIVEEPRPVAPFTEIENASTLKIVFQQSDNCSVTVKTDSNLQQYITTEVQNKRLIIKINTKQSLSAAAKSVITVSAPNIEQIVNNGVGDFDILGLSVPSLQITNRGVGNLRLEGQVESMIINNSGVGNFNAQNCTTDSITLNNSCVGNIKINADKSLSITSSGVGNITYSGNATINKLSDSGVGKIRKKE